MLRIIIMAALLAACSAERTSVAEGGNAGGGRAGQDDPCPVFDYERCVAFLPAERMQGVWITGFEQSSFVPGATTLPDPADPRRFRIWLDFAPGASPDPALRRALDEMRTTAVVAIAFDGRRSRDRGGYGHLNNAEHVVIVDRIISARLLGPLTSR